jgi:PAS domain S-box-containing protein
MVSSKYFFPVIRHNSRIASDNLNLGHKFGKLEIAFNTLLFLLTLLGIRLPGPRKYLNVLNMFNFDTLRNLYFSFKKQRHQPFGDSEAKYRDIVETSLVGVYIIQDGYFRYVNKKFCEIFGYSYEEIVDKITPISLAFESDKGMVSENVKKRFSKELKSIEYEFRGVKKDGSVVWIRVLGNLITYKDKPAICGTLIDITDRKLVDDALSLREERLRVTLEVTKIAIWDWDVQNDIWFASPMYYTMLGYAPVAEQSDRKVWLTRIHPDDRDNVMAKINDVLTYKADSYTYEARMLHADGSYRWHQVIGHIIEKDNQGRIKRIVGIRKDITDFKLTEEQLKVSRSRLRALIDTLPDLIWLKDPQGVYLQCNQRFEQLYGVSEKEIVGKTDYDFVSKELGDFFRQKDDEAVAAGKQNRNEEEVTFADGHKEILETIKTPIYENDGLFMGVLGIGRDITQRKKSEQELIRNEALIRTAVENLPIVFYLIDKDGIFNLSIGAGLKGLGLLPNQVVGQSVFDLYKDFPQTIEAINKALAGESVTFESNVNEVYYLNFVNPTSISDRRGGIVGVGLDITDRKKAEFELLSAKEKAEESDRLKTAFLQNMSHEIRTPMNAIMGFSDLLLSNVQKPDKLKQFTDIINQCCNDLLDIINDILDISKIESGQLSVSVEQCNLVDLFDELLPFFTEYQKRINKQHIKFSLQAYCDPSETLIIIDKGKLKQIFINLISNAFKFTDEGKVEAGCRFDNNRGITFYVSDTGIGIPLDKQQFVFERFTQLQHSSKFNLGGTGLGLSIVKALINLLGGEISLESEPGKGSTFSFTIPYKAAQLLSHQTSIDDRIIERGIIGKTILIVEDDPYNAVYIQEALSGKGINMLLAENGKRAIEISMSQRIDLVLMDIRMPDINGYEATRQIRQYNPHLKIIAHTAYAASDEKQKAFEAGCIDYISKPTKQDALLALLNKHLLF